MDFTIKIESILGGHSALSHFSGEGQFKSSLGIDPAQPINDGTTNVSFVASGLIRPAASEKFSGTTVTGAPMWFVPSPKDGLTYVFDSLGSVYSIGATFGSVTALGDLNDAGTAQGDGAEYYDNYVYFARSTTIARYGPLDGTPAFADDYWVGTLGKTRLTDNSNYPASFKSSVKYPRHVLHRHSDGKLYIADVADNKGVIHYIATTKTTVEGDTDDNSTYNKVEVGYGLYPTAIESYGADLAVAFYEGTNKSFRESRAKIAFWDTTSAKVNKIVWVEFPDQIITALKNINGILYVVSGNIQSNGFRVSRFIGGYTFEEVMYSETGEPCFAGAIDGTGKRLLLGSFTDVPETQPSVYSLGLQKTALGNGTFNVMGATGGSTSAVHSLLVADNDDFSFSVPIVGWTTGASGGTTNGIDKQGSSYGAPAEIWWSQVFRIGQPFKIKKIRFPLAQAIAANMVVVLSVYTDDGNGTTYELTEINNTNDSGKFNIVRRNDSNGNAILGQHNFWLSLRFSGSALCVVGLPIEIIGETIDD